MRACGAHGNISPPTNALHWGISVHGLRPKPQATRGRSGVSLTPGNCVPARWLRIPQPEKRCVQSSHLPKPDANQGHPEGSRTLEAAAAGRGRQGPLTSPVLSQATPLEPTPLPLPFVYDGSDWIAQRPPLPNLWLILVGLLFLAEMFMASLGPQIKCKLLGSLVGAFSSLTSVAFSFRGRPSVHRLSLCAHYKARP